MNVGLDVVSVVKKDKKYCPVQCWSSGGKKREKILSCAVLKSHLFLGVIVGSLTVLLDCLSAM